MKKYVWMNPITGKFSNSWNEELHQIAGGDTLINEEANKEGWKLIKYECVNDEDFEFINKMRLR